MSIFDDYLAQEQANSDVEMSLTEYLELCKNDPMAYASPAQRMLKDDYIGFDCIFESFA